MTQKYAKILKKYAKNTPKYAKIRQKYAKNTPKYAKIRKNTPKIRKKYAKIREMRDRISPNDDLGSRVANQKKDELVSSQQVAVHRAALLPAVVWAPIS